MIEQIDSELQAINNAIKHLVDVLDNKSEHAEMEWAREQMRIISMDLQELISVRNSLLKRNTNC